MKHLVNVKHALQQRENARQKREARAARDKEQKRVKLAMDVQSIIQKNNWTIEHIQLDVQNVQLNKCPTRQH